MYLFTQGMNQSCNKMLAFCMENWKMHWGQHHSSPLWRKTCVSLYKKNVRNRSVWEPDHFEFSDKKPFEPHKNCPGQSRFRVLSFSSLIRWWRVSGNILRICPGNLTISKKMTWYCKYCGDAWQIAGSSTQASRICGCVSIFKYLHTCVYIYVYIYICMHLFVFTQNFFKWSCRFWSTWATLN